MTPRIRRVVAACSDEEFETLPISTEQAGREIKATFRRLHFKARVKMTPDEHKRVAAWRQRRRIRGRQPIYREVHFWMRAAVLLDTGRQKRDAKRRLRRIEAYEAELKWTLDRLNQGRYYGDPEWVSGHLADLAHQFKDVRTFVKVDFTVPEGKMSLAYRQRPHRIADAARLDGRWLLVTNQRREAEQPITAYLDWMRCVYKNHRHVERRMRNLKSDLPIRPIYLHRDEAIVALCFVCVTALMVYTLIERDCQANPTLVKAGLRTTDEVLRLLGGFCVSVHRTPSGYEVFWPDTPTEKQEMIWQQLQIPDPGTRLPDARSVSQEAGSACNSASFFELAATQRICSVACGLPDHSFKSSDLSLGTCHAPQFWIVKVPIAIYLLCYAENQVQQRIGNIAVSTNLSFCVLSA
jgi:hypothetical protein